MSSVTTRKRSSGTGYLINQIQTLFVSLLRVWTIPIVIMLSVSSGYTTFYGMSHFITPWIALIITIAIQSIIVICSLEMAGIHWKANKMRYFSVVASLAIAISASITFSYFEFYEISEKENLHIRRINDIRGQVKDYIDKLLVLKSDVRQQQKNDVEKASSDATQAFLGTHSGMGQGVRNQVGEGPYWKHFNQILQEKKLIAQEQEQLYIQLDKQIAQMQSSLNSLDRAQNQESAYGILQKNFEDTQLIANQLSSTVGLNLPTAPMLMTYKQFVEEVKPSFAIWDGFSWFAFTCAAMVDFFTVLLSYRLEFSAPGPLTLQEEELVFECLKQFNQFSINSNDELELIIEKTELEKARRYSDWSRMFVIGLLLNRGFLRKIDHRTVEFSPNLYPLIAEKMHDKVTALRARSSTIQDFADD